MSRLVAGNTYLFRTIVGNVYHVEVLKVGKFYSLCRWQVDNLDYGYTYSRAGYKANWKIISL